MKEIGFFCKKIQPTSFSVWWLFYSSHFMLLWKKNYGIDLWSEKKFIWHKKNRMDWREYWNNPLDLISIRDRMYEYRWVLFFKNCIEYDNSTISTLEKDTQVAEKLLWEQLFRTFVPRLETKEAKLCPVFSEKKRKCFYLFISFCLLLFYCKISNTAQNLLSKIGFSWKTWGRIPAGFLFTKKTSTEKRK